MERLSLQEHARNMDLRSTEIWETELFCWTAKAEEFINTNDTARLRSVLVQIKEAIDFQIP